MSRLLWLSLHGRSLLNLIIRTPDCGEGLPGEAVTPEGETAQRAALAAARTIRRQNVTTAAGTSRWFIGCFGGGAIAEVGVILSGGGSAGCCATPAAWRGRVGGAPVRPRVFGPVRRRTILDKCFCAPRIARLFRSPVMGQSSRGFAGVGRVSPAGTVDEPGHMRGSVTRALGAIAASGHTSL